MTITLMLTLVVYDAKLTHLDCQSERNKKSRWRCGGTLRYTGKSSLINFSEIADGQFALCLLDSRQFRAEPIISRRGDHAVPTKLIDIQKLSISPP